MAKSEAGARTSYELPPCDDGAPVSVSFPYASDNGLSRALLTENVLWFCRLRWIAIALLILFGLLGMLGDTSTHLGLDPPGPWTFITAAVLFLSNLFFSIHHRSLLTSTRRGAAKMNLWGQIIVDLLVVTVVVHFVGSMETYVSFTYLFHIVLACIFFSRRQSLIVTLLSCGLYGACVSAELTGLVEPTCVFSAEVFANHLAPSKGVFAVDFFSAIGIWLIVWYLASHLSKMVRDRDIELARTNQRLIAAREERSRHMLTTTHQLKAPFAAIHTNAQLLLKGHCGPLSEPAGEVVERIATRARRLASEIKDMLQLANLSSDIRTSLAWEQWDLAQILRWCIDQVEPLAQERRVSIETDIKSALCIGVEDHLKMLLDNLLTNAITYSRPDGCISVKCRPLDSSRSQVIISDSGIGIPPDKLPHIFEEHYRTNEAVRHNKESSGLGLAIVAQAARMHRIAVRVESEPDVGTTFELEFVKENQDGVCDDR